MDDDRNAADLETGETEARTGRDELQTATGDSENSSMAAGTPSGAAGVANAELGTSGRPAPTILSQEQLAAVEAAGGAGFTPGRIAREQPFERHEGYDT